MERKIKISIFDKNTPKNIVLTGNGDYILDRICIDCIVSENIDGTFELDGTFFIDNEGLYKNITDEAILKVQLDYGKEIFRISKVIKSIGKIIVYARQITISETLDMWVEDIRPTNTSGLVALNNLKNNSIGKKDIDFYSDIDTLATAYYQRMSLYQAIHTSDQAFINRWGGEVQRRGYSITINKTIGQDRGVEIRSRKNLTGFEATTNIDNVITRIRPVGYNGLFADRFVDSTLINNYSSIKTKEIEYSDIKVKGENDSEGFDTEAEAKAELIRRAEQEFTVNKIDQLRAEYRINFIYLEQTEQYKNYVQAERVFIGDTVGVFEEKHNINILVRVINKKYDVMAQRVLEIELSNYEIAKNPTTITSIVSEIQNIINTTGSNNFKGVIQSMINSGVDDSYVLYRQNELLVLDNKDINSAMKVIRINKNGLGFSKTGYYGQYDYGFTIDGVINASLISTGVLSAILIQNADGSLQIDLSGSNGIMTRRNGKNAIELSGQQLKFYDWDGVGDPVGQLFSSRLGGNANKSGLVLANESGSYLTLAHEGNTENTFNAYMRLDQENITGDSPCPIQIFKETNFRGSQLWFKHGINSIYNSATDNFIINVKNDFMIADRENNLGRLNLKNNEMSLYDVTSNNRYSYISQNETFFGSNGRKYFSCRPDGFSFWQGDNDIFYTTVGGGIHSEINFSIGGDLAVTGNKNCIQNTENHGSVLYYSVEDCESYLTDRSMELFTVEKTSKGTFERKILLDDIYKESINLDLNYTVEIIKQGWGDYRIKEQTKDYFIVESDKADFTFKYIITGKRKGFEAERNKPFINNNISKIDRKIITEGVSI